MRLKIRENTGAGGVNSVRPIESSVTKVSLCVSECLDAFQCVSLPHEGLLSLCPCGHLLLLGLLPARLKAEVWRLLPHLCADKTARRLL